MCQARVGLAVSQVMSLLQIANVHFQAAEPWSVPAAADGDIGPRERAIWSALEAIRVSLILLQPVVRIAPSPW